MRRFHAVLHSALPTSKLTRDLYVLRRIFIRNRPVVSALVSLFMLAFARSFLGFLALLAGSVANYALMLAIAVFAAPYWAFAYSITLTHCRCPD